LCEKKVVGFDKKGVYYAEEYIDQRVLTVLRGEV
jgi:hypothetical protein